MNPCHRGLLCRRFTFDKGEVQAPTDGIYILMNRKRAVCSGHLISFGPGYGLLVCNTIVNQINNGTDLEVMLLGKFFEI